MLKKSKRKNAFTLIELLVVLIIVALLMAIIIPNVAGQKARIEKQATHNIAQIVETQVSTYQLAEADDSVTLGELKENGYLTSKQFDEAKRLLKLEDSTSITIPIQVNE